MFLHFAETSALENLNFQKTCSFSVHLSLCFGNILYWGKSGGGLSENNKHVWATIWTKTQLRPTALPEN